MHIASCTPDTILYNAHVYSVNSAYPWAEAVAIQDGRIVGLGDSADVLSLADASTTVVDMGQRLMLPGFCDAHIHFVYWSLALAEVDLSVAESKAHMLELIHERALTSPDDAWIIGRGWNESWWGDTEYPTAKDIDSVTRPDQKAMFWRTDMHAAVVNTQALRLARITSSTPNPFGGVIEHDGSGEPTGILKDLAIQLVDDLAPIPGPAETLAAIRRGTNMLHSLGVTSIHDQRMKDHDDGIAALAAYQALDNEHELQLRINCNVAAHHLPHLEGLGLSYGFGNEHLRIGHIKVFADGSLGSQTCLMKEPFAKHSASDEDNVGVRLSELSEITDYFERAMKLGFPVSIHAIGDRANTEVLDLFEELQDRFPATQSPNRIEHAQILDPVDIHRLADMKLTASVQPVHIIDDIDIADRLLGERTSRLYNFRSLLAVGALLAFGSDAPVADPNPFLGIHAALYRQKPRAMAKGSWHEEQCISLEQALYAYTLGAARAAGWQDVIGSIEIGKRADLIALDRDLFALVDAGVTSDELAATQVDMTLFDGKITHSRL